MKIENELRKYAVSEQLLEDISWHKNVCHIEEKPIPSDEEIKAILLEEKRNQLEAEAICEQQGHDLTETADGENGISELDCSRCGQSFICQW